ncbi:hypothetical protein V9T40_004326 [Parthenolecanium corni]|uniref:Coiled-coil domain-containing protein 28B n=1 Tax=Parthenolecanium corni TaxID=536013 RepID=A0AAN9Y8I2_9HEMI
MSAEESECELQQLVSSDEENGPPNKGNVIASGSNTKPFESIQRPQTLHKVASDHSYRSSKISSIDNSVIEESSQHGSKLSRNTTIPSSSNLSTHAFNVSTGSHAGNTKTFDHKPPRPPQPNLKKLQNKKVMTLDRSSQHHCFLSDVMDVRQMEQALLHLLDDFHSGKLRAFGKNCSMEQMTAIHQQQEHLARLHFELGAQQELFVPLSEEGLRQGVDNMRSLMDSLEQLSLSIEKLHVINSKTD